MGPPEDPTHQIEKQEAHGRQRQGGRPRPRQCLLKGCERRFRPKHARQRYCSPQCREAARAWSGWKARRVYRATAAGKQKRNRQSQRYRKRVIMQSIFSSASRRYILRRDSPEPVAATVS
jgi:hypothetical protein